MRIYVNFTSIILAFTLLLTLTGCQAGNKSVDKLDSEEYRKLVEEIDKITAAFSASGNSLPIAEEFMKARDEKKADLALDLADDMAQAQLFGIVNDDILALSGEAVKAYPHPLLLNNYGALLIDAGYIEDSLYFFHKAELQDAKNPVLLTNIANTYLDLGDFSAAENYARKALSAAADFGAAYQVLTTIHMQREQYKLAAQYLLKSAKNCFNDISQYQFESFLDEVERLDPEEYDYPLDEQQIEDFRKAAIENVDTRDMNDSVDTPGAQLKLKPFPQIGSPDNLMRSYDYLSQEKDKFQQKYSSVSSQIMELSNKAQKDSSDNVNSGELIYPVEKNLRQIYALEVLQSFYEYKLKQSQRRYFNRLRETEKDRNDEINRLEKNYKEKREVMADDSKSADEILADLFSALITDENKLPEITKKLDNFTKAAVAYQKVIVDEHREKLDRSKNYTGSIVNILEESYNETRQLLEEFWLKAGGLLKCLADEDTFELYDLKRQQVVCSYAGFTVSELQDQAYYLEGLAFNLKMEEKALETAIALAQQSEQAKKETEAAYAGGDTVPDLEKEAISTYPEKNDFGAIGAEVDAFGFSGTVQYASEADGDKIKVSAGAPVLGSMGGAYTLDGKNKGTKNAYAVHGVSVTADTGWFKDSKIVEKALENSGIAGKVLGKIGFGFSGSKSSGQYVQTGSNGHITDRGVVQVRESSGSIGLISKTETVEVRKSLMTGVAIKQTSTKYKFIFFTYEK